VFSSPSRRILARNRRWFPQYRRSHEIYLDIVRAHARVDTVVLHLGAGRDSFEVARHIKARAVVSVDVDAKGLLKNPNSIRLIADVAHLPFRSGSSGMALFENVFEHLTDPEGALLESHRVLAVGSALVFLCPNRFSYVAILAQMTPHPFHVWFRRRLSATAEEDTFDTYYRLNSMRRIRALAERCGFQTEMLQSYVGWPTYWEFSDLLHRCAVVAHWLLERGPRVLHMTLVGVLRKQAAV
jgi:SAM-dependent methyltransferase